MAKIVLQRGKEKKIQNFYPNVFQDEIQEKIGTMKTGDLVDIVTEEMEFVARGYVTEGSSAYVRVLSTKEEKIDKSFFQRSEEHTSELQSRQYLVCRLLLEKIKLILYISSTP